MKKIFSQNQVKIKSLPGKAPTVPIAVLEMNSFQSAYVWPRNNGNNASQGVAARILAVKGKNGWVVPKQPSVDLRERFKHLLREFSYYATQVHPMTDEQYIDSLDNSRKSRYRNAWFLKPKIGKAQQFVKLEPADITKKEPVARIITDPGPTYNMTIGLYVKPMEKAVFSALSEWLGYPVVLKGFNSAEQARHIRDSWEVFANPVCVSGDASRFDAHTGVAIRRDLELEVYRLFLRGDDKILKMMEGYLSTDVVCRTRDQVLTYRMNSRKSGEHNTGLGNSVITVFMVIKWCRDKNVDFRLHNNGDDWFVILESKTLSWFLDGALDYFSTNGYSMVLEEPVYEFEQIEFCQTKPVMGPLGYVMVRDPRKALVKDLQTYRVRTVKEHRRWAASVAECGLAMSSGIPVMQSFYRYFHRTALGSRSGSYMNEFGRKTLSRGMCYRYTPVSDDSRYSFYLAFDIDPETQVALEQYFESVDVVSISEEEFVPHVVENADTVIETTGL